jgi:hypothetical protein
LLYCWQYLAAYTDIRRGSNAVHKADYKHHSNNILAAVAEAPMGPGDAVDRPVPAPRVIVDGDKDKNEDEDDNAEQRSDEDDSMEDDF